MIGELPKYCTKCGCKLESYFTRVSRYDESNGGIIRLIKVKCPKKTVWNLHTQYTCGRDDKGENFS